MPQSFAALYIHAVFSTEDRAAAISPVVQPRLNEYIGGLCRARDSVLLAAGGTNDHIHLLVSLSREHAVADFMRDIKANSSKWIHEAFPDQRSFGWQDGYGVFSVSHSNLNGVKEYLARQAEHHRKHTFQEEFLELLRRHNVAFDERYIWK